MTTINVRAELNKVATQLETLAREVRSNLAAEKDAYDVANELVKNSIMLTFGLGELYALSNSKNVSVKAPRATSVAVNWQRPRDTNGRFARVVRP